MCQAANVIKYIQINLFLSDVVLILYIIECTRVTRYDCAKRKRKTPTYSTYTIEHAHFECIYLCRFLRATFNECNLFCRLVRTMNQFTSDDFAII